MHKISYMLCIVFIFSSQELFADRGLQLKQMQNEQRVALVIGNNHYTNLSKLKNPLNDAKAMKQSLEARGFEVLYQENANNATMRKLIKKFSKRIAKGGIGLYYFAGHGINIDGRNYLVGTDASMDDKDEVAYQNIALDYLTTKMKSAKNRLNIVILDACRNDPFSRGAKGGLAPVSNAKGIFVAYATEAGSVASDGRHGKHGLFTKYLIKHMQTAGADISKVFKSVRQSVLSESKDQQSPGVYDQTVGDFYFTLPNGNTADFKTSNAKHSFVVTTQPKDAKVEILNSRIHYRPNISLPAGNYEIRISKAGYQSKRGNIKLNNDLALKITLNQQKKQEGFENQNSSVAKTASPFLKRFDKNANNALEKEELPLALAKKFSLLDKDKSGSIELSEIQAMMAKKPLKAQGNIQAYKSSGDEAFFDDGLEDRFSYQPLSSSVKKVRKPPPPPPPHPPLRRPPPPRH